MVTGITMPAASFFPVPCFPRFTRPIRAIFEGKFGRRVRFSRFTLPPSTVLLVRLYFTVRYGAMTLPLLSIARQRPKAFCTMVSLMGKEAT